VQFHTRLFWIFFAAAAFCGTTAHAQFQPSRPAEQPQLPGMQPQLPSMQSAPIQTPTITNVSPSTLPQRPGAEFRPGADAAKPAARPLDDRNEFQQFIEASTGRRLPIFGHDLFEGAPSTFAPVENVAVPADYVIGPGDELLVRAWGQIDVDYRAVVDRNGTIPSTSRASARSM
jgi:hypothetical protein